MNPEIDESDVRPWAKPGAVRRDCEPHRGKLIVFAGRLSITMGLTGCCMPLLLLPAWGLLLFALVVSRQDLPLIERGLMDRDGETMTRHGGRAALVGMLVSLISSGIWLYILIDALLR